MKLTLLSSFLFAVVMAGALGTVPAHATLGEPESSIDNVRRATRMSRTAGVRRSSGTASFTVHELKDNGGTIREYVSPTGVVFAVTWTGHRSPDLKTVLGSYEGEYRSLLSTRRPQRGQRNAEVSSQRLIATRGGHMRRLRGRFIEPTLLPAGVKLNDIQ